jgi:hypothetical protein
MGNRCFKVLGRDRQPYYGGNGRWPEPGEWLEVEGDLIPCEHGIHLCRRPSDLLGWLGPEIWEAEHSGDVIECDNKIVVRRARLVRRFDTWNDRTARLFAVDCAYRVAHVMEDQRSLNALHIASEFAEGRATTKDLAAARDAARDAARAAAWDAARDAARAAAWSAAWDDAARAAARDAARAAAWDAARAAAWDDAARADAARAAAWSAERKWQAERLMEVLKAGGRGRWDARKGAGQSITASDVAARPRGKGENGASKRKTNRI